MPRSSCNVGKWLASLDLRAAFLTTAGIALPMPVSGRPHASKTSVQRSTNLPVVAIDAAFADHLGRHLRELINQVIAHDVRRSTALIEAFHFNPSCQRLMDLFDKVLQDQMAILETKSSLA